MSGARAIPVRFRILGVLFVMCFVNYLLRNNLSIAIPSIQREFSFTNAEIGWILGSFNFSYALLQIPGGIFGQIYGPRRALTFIAVSWGVLTFLTGFIPTLMAASATGVMVSLFVTRLLLGATNAPIFPVIGGHLCPLVSRGRLGFPQWGNERRPGARAGGDRSDRHPADRALRLARIFLRLRAAGPAHRRVVVLVRPRSACAASCDHCRRGAADRGRSAAREPALRERGGWRHMLVHRDVLLIAASYFCMNYVFYMFAQWLFTYLVEARGFSLLESGWLYVLPFATGAVLAGVGGLTCDALCKRLGANWGCRLPAMTGLILVAIFLIAGVYASNPYLAVGLLSLCFGFTQFTEGAFWSASTYVAGPHTSAATGVMNTGGNAAGFLAPVVGLMVDHLGWLATLASGSVFALTGACLWLLIRIRPGDRWSE